MFIDREALNCDTRFGQADNTRSITQIEFRPSEPRQEQFLSQVYKHPTPAGVRFPQPPVASTLRVRIGPRAFRALSGAPYVFL